MCKNLVEKGNLSQPLTIYNRTALRASELSSKIGHSVVAASIEEAVSKADIIFFCLGDDAAVHENVSKALNGNVEGKLFVDCSTIHPETTAIVAKEVEAHGAHFVACPVSGRPAMADAGQLVCVLAGSRKQVDKVKPYCDGVMGRATINYGGSTPNKGTLLEITGNTFILSMIETILGGHVVAEKTCLGVDNLHRGSRQYPAVPMLRTRIGCDPVIITRGRSRCFRRPLPGKMHGMQWRWLRRLVCR